MSEDTYTKLRAIADEYSSGIEDEAFDYALMRAYNAGVEDGTPLLDIIMKARDEALSLANKRHGEAIRAREAERAAIVKWLRGLDDPELADMIESGQHYAKDSANAI